MAESGEKLLRQAAQALEQHGLHLELIDSLMPLPEVPADAKVRIRHPEGQLDLRAEIKFQLNTSNYGPAIGQLRKSGQPSVLIADYINPKLAERLRQQEVLFLDACGNVFLRGPGLYIWVTGRRNETELQRLKEPVRAFQPSGLKLIFALLCRPDWVATDYRTLASATGTALGTVHRVMRDLVQERYVRRIGRNSRVLLRPKELLDVWAQGFVRDLRPRLLLGRFAAADIAWWRQTDPREYGALWGGEPAGARLTGFLKPGTLTIYAEKLPAKLLLEQHLKQDERGRIDVLRKFWRFAHDEESGLVPAVLAYADLLAVGDDRTLETAERLFDQHIDGSFRAYLAHTAG